MMKFRKFFMLSALLTIFSFSCDVTPEEYEGEPNIYAILTTDSFAQVMVGRTFTINDTVRVKIIIDFDTIWDVEDEDTIPVPLWNGVSGAEVSLKQGGHRYVLLEDPDSAGYYNTDSIQFSARKTWKLEVTYPSGEEIEAQTTIPGSFEITGFQTDTVSNTDTLAWSKSSDAAGYLVKAFVWASWEDEDADTVHIDSAFTYPELLPGDSYSIPLEELDLWGDSLWFWVAALDTNAYDYRYYGEDRGDPGIRVEDYMHIEGAWGVFGSQVVACSQRYVLR